MGITSALFGIAAVDAGCNWRPLVPAGWRPGVIVKCGVLAATDFSAGRVWPDLGLTALWRPHRNCYWYAGVDNWFETHQTRYDNNPQTHHWLPVIHTGVDIGGKFWQWQVEGTWYVPNIDATRHTAKTIEVGRYGCLGVFFGVNRSFKKAEKSKTERG